MKTPILLCLLFIAACGNSKPADQPAGQTPGQSAPASPGSAWTSSGGPATPGAPATGSVETTDAGKR